MSETVTITGIAAGGDGVGRMADGCAVFVPRTAPGDQVVLDAAHLVRRKRYARGAVAELLAPAADRVTPPCPHYERDRCGGCQLQHLSYEAQLAVKRRIVGDTLRRIGKVEIADPEIVEAVEEFRYRTSITLEARRGGPGQELVLGLHPHDQPGRVFPLADCHIVDLRLIALWRVLRTHLDLLPPQLTRVTLRLGRDGRRHVIVASAGPPWATAADLSAALGQGDTVCWWQPAGGAARVLAGSETGFPAVAFEPVNPEVSALAHRWAIEALGGVASRTVWDLYGGTGDTARLLAEAGADVISVDADEQAVDWARGRPAPRAIRFIAGRVEDVVTRLPAPAAVVVNPPADGLHWDVTVRLTAAPVPRLAYISSDPATLARDLYRLGAVYRLTALRAFDRFPQTAAVETVAVLEAA